MGAQQSVQEEEGVEEERELVAYVVEIENGSQKMEVGDILGKGILIETAEPANQFDHCEGPPVSSLILPSMSSDGVEACNGSVVVDRDASDTPHTADVIGTLNTATTTGTGNVTCTTTPTCSVMENTTPTTRTLPISMSVSEECARGAHYPVSILFLFSLSSIHVQT